MGGRMGYELVHNTARRAPKLTTPAIAKAYRKLPKEDERLRDSDATATRQGVGACKDVCADISEFTCSACGFNCELASWISLFDGDGSRHGHHYHGTPNFCPNCGRKVVD